MRIWSLHPKYLDAKGLVALWRETLLAKHVLEGKTKGYVKHPQLDRFKAQHFPAEAVHQYLHIVFEEAQSRGYQFDESKFDKNYIPVKMPVNQGQMEYEAIHLLNKLSVRDLERFEQLREEISFEPHPIFNVIEGGVEEWEIM